MEEEGEMKLKKCVWGGGEERGREEQKASRQQNKMEKQEGNNDNLSTIFTLF